MAREKKHSEERTLQLVHPVYLDVPMLVSFVAAAEDGFALESEQTEKGATATDRSREAGGRARAGFPGLGALAGLDMSGRFRRGEQEEESRETKVIRQHTEASLFNLLRHTLMTEGRIRVTERADELDDIEIGALVEMSGEIVGNPLSQMLDLFSQILPYLGYDVEVLMKPKKRKDSSRSGNPATRAEASPTEDLDQEDLFRLLATMRDDLDSSSIRDLVLIGPENVRAVLTLSTEFLTAGAADRLLGGRFTVIGKVTRVLVVHPASSLADRGFLALVAKSSPTGSAMMGVSDGCEGRGQAGRGGRGGAGEARADRWRGEL